ncbi:unnamed protein product [Schistocephalus solidus]|uniref:WD_REPEATS_REGION domain-containing protein n=1 Tax=Schistocephalus solidus TaxID=70667 RepID=A0A183TN92_SCHSO|nr:unnamed protein product [Schistocephalus solidus]
MHSQAIPKITVEPEVQKRIPDIHMPKSTDAPKVLAVFERNVGSQSAHPGSVVHLCESPQDMNKMLIGFSSGLIVLWDLRGRSAEARFSFSEVSLHQFLLFRFQL